MEAAETVATEEVSVVGWTTGVESVTVIVVGAGDPTMVLVMVVGAGEPTMVLVTVVGEADSPPHPSLTATVVGEAPSALGLI